MDNNKKIIIGIIVFVLILCIFFLLKKNVTDNAKLELNGGTEIILYENDQWIDPGYKIINESGNGYYVNTEGSVYTNSVGAYYISYYLYNKKGNLIYKTIRRVIVLEDQNSNIEMKLNGEQEEYYFVDDYTDKGAIVYQNNIDISSNIMVIDDVVANKVGNYEVRYQVNDKNGIKEIIRYVHIIDYQIDDYSDEVKMTIDFLVNCDDYAYTVLPDGIKEYSKDISFAYHEEGTYTFDIYLKSGSHKEYKVTIDSIDHEGPKGTCSLSFDQNNTKITINANDKSGISKYTYNGIDFNSSTRTISGIVGNVMIRVYDKKNNYTDIKCKANYGTGFRNIELSKNGEIKNKLGYIKFPTNFTKENKELDDLMQAYGYKTRDAVAAAAVYLAQYKYDVPYFWGGKYAKKGFNSEWGSRHSHTVNKPCSVPLSSDHSYCEWGLDCTGYTKWAFVQAGFDANLIRTSDQSGGKWGGDNGNFVAKNHRYTFSSSNFSYANKLKPGDIVATPGVHVGMVIGVSQDTIQVANEWSGIKISIIKKSNGASTNSDKSFTHFVLMDDFYKMYGNN